MVWEEHDITLPGIRWFFLFLFLFLVILNLGQFLSFRLSRKHGFYEFCLFLLFCFASGGNVEKWGSKPPSCLQEPWSVSKARGLKNALKKKSLVFTLVFILSHLIGTILLIMLSPLHIWRNWENTQLDMIIWSKVMPSFVFFLLYHSTSMAIELTKSYINNRL